MLSSTTLPVSSTSSMTLDLLCTEGLQESLSVYSGIVSKRNLDFGELFADRARPKHFRTLRRVRRTFMD